MIVSAIAEKQPHPMPSPVLNAPCRFGGGGAGGAGIGGMYCGGGWP